MKLDGYDFKGMPQEVLDFKDKITEVINYGKYQKPIVTSPPTWKGRYGEEVYYAAGGSWALLVCTSDNSATWSTVTTFS